jgi:hypothetical protein
MQRRFVLAYLVAAFVLVASHCPAQRPDTGGEARRKALAEEDAAERLGGEELKSRVPDLRIAKRSPAVVFAPILLSLSTPYQLAGIGGALDLLPVPWFRASVSYSFGLSFERSQNQSSHYANASVGLRVLGVDQDMAVDLHPNGFPTLLRSRVTIVKAWLPARHALFVEGGAMTGLAFLAHCRGATCDELIDAETADRQQLVMPFAGLRYTVDYRADSRRQGTAKRLFVQVYAHALMKPLEVESADRFLSDGTSAGNPGWGGRAGFRVLGTGDCLFHFLFGWRCADAPGFGSGLELGYAPYPRAVLARLEIGYFVY